MLPPAVQTSIATTIQFRVLYREFLFRIVDLELLSGQADMSKLLGQFASLLVFVSLLLAFPALAFEKMTGQMLLIGSWSAEHFLIATTMLVVGLFAVLSWDGTFPDKRDVLVLAPLPIRARTLFLAKVAAVATALGLTVAILNALAGLIWPFALASQPDAIRFLTLTSDPAMTPVKPAELQSVLSRDFAAVLKNGQWAPGTGAGIAIGLTKHGERRTFAFGATQPDSIFEVGSITKTFTALILARMAADGKVNLEAPVRELLPDGTVRKPHGLEITLLDLATQHSGLPRMPTNFHPADKNNPYADYHAADLYDYIKSKGVGRLTHEEFLYSNLGFGLLGQALANRAGMRYEDLVKEEVTGPLGMQDTVISLSPEQRKRFIPGHDDQHRPVHAWDLDGLAGAGAIRSTIGDMLAYLEANLHPERILPSTLSEALIRSHQLRADAGPDARIGLAWIYDPKAGNYWHNGATAGYTGDATFNPKDDYALIVLSNTGSNTTVSAGIIANHIRSRLSGKPAISLTELVVPARGGMLALIRSYAVYWLTMLLAGAFIFCCVLGIQGLAAQLLPRRLFLRVSSFLQLATFCLFVSVYFLQPMLAIPGTLLEAQSPGPMAWLPSYWFLGLFQQLNGSPALAPLAGRAWLALAIAGGGTAVAYALSYFRTLRKIVEEPDIIPGSGSLTWLPRFGDSLETAVVQFSIRTLLRSRQHRVLLAFYLGVGFAVTIALGKEPAARELAQSGGSERLSLTLIASSVVMLAVWVVGTRVVFSRPLDLRANWIFRVTPVRGAAECLAASRRALFLLGVMPVWIASAVLFLSQWPWRPAMEHLAVLGLLGLILAECCLHGFQKIPFTCSYLPGKSYFHMAFLVAAQLLFLIIVKGADFERRAIEDPASGATMLLILGSIAACARWRTTVSAKAEDAALQFEDTPTPAIFALEIHKDGVVPL